MHITEIMEHSFKINYFALPWAVLVLIALALVFDFLNGLHDAANSIATIVSTRVLTPPQAVLWAAFFNVIAFLIFNFKVAGTIGTGIINPDFVNSNSVIAGTLIGACAWNILTWYLGLPPSSSHALIGGLVGAGLVHAAWSTAAAGVPIFSAAWFEALKNSLVWGGILWTCLFIVVAPMIGLFTGLMMISVVSWLFRRARPRNVDTIFRRGQLLSAAAYLAFGHGGNDAQKTMGIILLLLISSLGQAPQAFPAGTQTADLAIPLEIVLACYLAMGLGTMMGGWRIVKTMGQGIIRLRPVDGFCAETGAAFTLVLTILFGIPVSTTHTITGSIIGVGSAQRFSAA